MSTGVVWGWSAILLRTIISLVFVSLFAVAGIALWGWWRRKRKAPVQDESIRELAARPLGSEASLHFVQVQERRLLLGVSRRAGVSVLAEFPPPADSGPEPRSLSRLSPSCAGGGDEEEVHPV